jgi:type IV pilus assembly protein PilX
MRKSTFQQGFVLATSLIFLVIMTLLAVTAIRRATLDEKVTGNLREQNLAFQAAERALRYCQNEYEQKRIIPREKGLPSIPIEWESTSNWVVGSGIATQLPAGTVRNVISQPQCMIEKWDIATSKDQADPTKSGLVHLITARGVGSTANAVVWLQVTLRDGSESNL